MKIKVEATLVGIGFALVGCAAGGPTFEKVSGHRDDVKHVTAIVTTTHEAIWERQCTKKVKGVCKKYKSVKVGTRTVKHVVRQERWCVELDDVNGDKTEDDFWFRTSPATYLKAASLAEGDYIKFQAMGVGC